MSKQPEKTEKSEDLSRTEHVLFSLKREAKEAKNHEAFLIAEKKIMLTCLAYVARFMMTVMTNKRRKSDIKHVKEAVLGCLSIIHELDKGEEQKKEG